MTKHTAPSLMVFAVFLLSAAAGIASAFVRESRAWPTLAFIGCVISGIWLFGQVLLTTSGSTLFGGKPSTPTSWRLVTVKDHPQASSQILLEPQPAAFTRPVTSPDVSVIVTAYNQSRLLAHTLSSLQHQTLRNWEAIVVNDAATDLTLDVALQFAARDRRFRVVDCVNNGGLSAARNLGISQARSDLITFLDGDDVLFPEALELRVLAVPADNADPSLAGAFCDWTSFWGEEIPDLPAKEPTDHGPRTAMDSPYETPFIVSAPVFKKTVIENVGSFDEQNVGAEDADMWNRVLRAGWHFNYVPYIGVGYRQIEGSLLRQRLLHNATVHREVAARSDRPVDDPRIAGGPMPYTEPMATYLREKIALERNLRFATMALASGDRKTAETLIAQVDDTVLRTCVNASMLEACVRGALRRLGWTWNGVLRKGPEFERALASMTSAAARKPVAPITNAITSQAHPPLGNAYCEVAAKVVVSADMSIPDGAVVLLPESRYHLDELGPLSRELQNRGIPAVFMARSGPLLREEVLRETGKYVSEVCEWDPGLPLRTNIRAVVTMNDWGPAKELISNAQSRGIMTFAKVEGVQDFQDRDTGRERRPYQTADIILGQGSNDVAALPGQHVEVVGNSRLERIWSSGKPSRGLKTAAINLNFTYHVQTDHADSWLRSAIKGCQAAGFDPQISLHPAQKLDLVGADLLANRICPDPLRHMLTYSGALITRFSTVVYEAAARGVPVIYHNPHNERVWEAFETTDAVAVTRSASELAAALSRAEQWLGGYRRDAEEFFRAQIDVQQQPSEVRTADVIERHTRKFPELALRHSADNSDESLPQATS